MQSVKDENPILLLIEELKALIIEILSLEDLSPADIDAKAPLFGDGLGLDSIDALEIGMALSKTYGITVDVQSDKIKEHFASVQSLAEFVYESRSQPC